MIQDIIQNIKNFYDVTIFFAILIIGIYTLLVDYPHYKRIKLNKDASVTLAIGAIFIVLPFILLIITRM